MCGFICAYNDKSFNLKKALLSIKHRGPDSSKEKRSNNWQIGFNRLSIVAPESDFDQPYTEDPNEDCLVFNGEIYNFKELQNDFELYKKYSSDTQTLYKLIKDKRHQILSKLDGIFAFAYINFRERKVLISRDFFGVKPLYYFFEKETLYISSELSPIKNHMNLKFNYKGLVDYLSYGKNWNSETIYESIKQVNPGEYIYFDLEKISYKVYNFKIKKNINFKTKSFSEVFKDSVRSQTPNIPFGILYSGGIDSTLLLLESKSNKFLDSLYSITIDRSEMDESFWQEYAINKLNILNEHIKIKENKENFSRQNICNSVSDLDLPITHPNFLGALAISKKANEKGLKVLLSGEGADELFCGYRWHLLDNLDALEKESILGYVPSKVIAYLLGVDNYIPPDFNKFNIDDFFINSYLQRWLTRADLTGMKYSIENRVPFLSNISYQFSQSLNIDEKTENKRIGKKLLKGELTNSLGFEFANRKKRGFDYPLNDWVDNDLENLVFKISNNNSIKIKELIEPYKKNYLYSRIIFILSSFFIWENDNFI